MKKVNDEQQNPLTREIILKLKEQPSKYTLPSGTNIKVSILSYKMSVNIRNRFSDLDNQKSGCKFVYKVIEELLRDNRLKKLDDYSTEDQNFLIELASTKWGCKDEYEQLEEISDLEIRFCKAVQLMENNRAELFKRVLTPYEDQYSATIANMALGLSKFNTPLRDIQLNIGATLASIAERIKIPESMTSILYNFGQSTIEKFGDIYEMTSPIIQFSEQLENIQKTISLSNEQSIIDSLEKTMKSYQAILADAMPIQKFATLPDEVRFFPTIEMHNTSIIGSSFIEDNYDLSNKEIITPTKVEIMDWLDSIHSELSKMLLGAEETIYSENPDHCRHFASSHRELITHVLHELSPDDKVREWTNDVNYYDKSGKPTRKCRLKFIARNCDNAPLVDFFVKDIETQIELLNADEHRLAQNYSEPILTILHQKYLSSLEFIKQISSAN